MVVKFNEEKQEEKLRELHLSEEENLSERLSGKYSLPYIDLSVTPINIDALRIIKEIEARKAEVAPFNIINKKVSVGIFSPNNPLTIEALENLKTRGYLPSLYMVSKESLEKVWGRYKDLSFSFETKSGAIDISSDEILNISNSVK